MEFRTFKGNMAKMRKDSDGVKACAMAAREQIDVFQRHRSEIHAAFRPAPVGSSNVGSRGPRDRIPVGDEDSALAVEAAPLRGHSPPFWFRVVLDQAPVERATTSCIGIHSEGLRYLTQCRMFS